MSPCTEWSLCGQCTIYRCSYSQCVHRHATATCPLRPAILENMGNKEKILELLTTLDLAADPNLAEAGKTEDDETLQLRVDFLEAEQDGAKMAAFNRLVRKKDEALAAKDVELAELRARLAEA